MPDLPPDQILNAIITTGLNPQEVRAVRIEWITDHQARIWITLRNPPPPEVDSET